MKTILIPFSPTTIQRGGLPTPHGLPAETVGRHDEVYPPTCSPKGGINSQEQLIEQYYSYGELLTQFISKNELKRQKRKIMSDATFLLCFNLADFWEFQVSHIRSGYF